MYEIMNFNLYNRNEIFTAPIKTIEIKFTLLTSIFPLMHHKHTSPY